MRKGTHRIIGTAALAGVFLAAGAAGAQADELAAAGPEAETGPEAGAAAVLGPEAVDPFDGFLSEADARFAEELAHEAHENELRAAEAWAEENGTASAAADDDVVPEALHAEGADDTAP